MMNRVIALSAAVWLLGAPCAALAQVAAAPDQLPFGRSTIVNGAVDRSSIVWSRCGGTDGSAGRWIAVRPSEVVHPTYVVDQEALPLDGSAAQTASLPRLVECIAADGTAGLPDPSLPPQAVLPRGTTIVYSAPARPCRRGPTPAR